LLSGRRIYCVPGMSLISGFGERMFFFIGGKGYKREGVAEFCKLS
jgi:hypothetical protein